jgi:hypothetical protein
MGNRHPETIGVSAGGITAIGTVKPDYVASPHARLAEDFNDTSDPLT